MRLCDEFGCPVNEDNEDDVERDFLDEVVDERTEKNTLFAELVAEKQKVRRLATLLQDVVDSYEQFTASLTRAKKYLKNNE